MQGPAKIPTGQAAVTVCETMERRINEMWCWGSAATAFYRPSLALQLGNQAVTVVSLNFDNALLDSAATATKLFEFTRVRLEFGCPQGQSTDQRDPFALAPLGFARDTYDAVTGRSEVPASALASGYLPLAFGAQAAEAGGVYQGARGFRFHS